MKIKPIFAAFVLTMSGQSATAGCADYTEGGISPAPLFEICYEGTCDIAAMVFECANQFSFQTAYDVGWSKECVMETGECTVYWENRPIADNKLNNITCRALDDDNICNLP